MTEAQGFTGGEAAAAPGTDDQGPPTRIWAVVGGIASGKSTVSRALAGPDGVILDADSVAHAVLASPEVVELIRQRFGEGAIGPDGLPNRAALGAIVFSDSEARKDLEGWIHGRVRARLRADLESAVRNGVPRIVLDVPLLLENAEEHGLLDLVDLVVFVDAPLEERDRRATLNRGWEPGEVARREAAQMPLATKRARADVVIDNDATEAELAARASALVEGRSGH